MFGRAVFDQRGIFNEPKGAWSFVLFLSLELMGDNRGKGLLGGRNPGSQGLFHQPVSLRWGRDKEVQVRKGTGRLSGKHLTGRREKIPRTEDAGPGKKRRKRSSHALGWLTSSFILTWWDRVEKSRSVRSLHFWEKGFR